MLSFLAIFVKFRYDWNKQQFDFLSKGGIFPVWTRLQS